MVTPYDNYSDAETAIADMVADCLAFNRSTVVPTTFTADQTSATQFVTAMDINYGNAGIWCSITVGAGTDLAIGWSGTIDTMDVPSANAILFTCDTGVSVMEDFGSGNSGTLNLNSISEGTYILLLNFGGPATNANVTFTVDASATMVVNPVIALWDDGGTTRQLEACPKTNIPDSFGEGNWYADETEAQTAIDTETSNCIAYCRIFDTFEATDTGTSLILAGARPSGAGLTCWASISLATSGTITATYSNALGGFFAVYESDGATLVASFTGAGPHTTGTVPPGKYYVNTTQLANMANPAGDVIITSSVAFTVNPIQALYDVGLSCPAMLDCTE